ncbi:GNAT superfamily N-acetyltransferase [Microbacterium terrae]|uniref:Acetyltransferase (GNAT) family protein n=1 Tax=Microbacterium terrae TaxID=69369 RepID=A0A0M2H4B7_9MICO|nr:GNAT family N-acetyltransferase [Microbacterium terrae]KJL41306.1 Acetyltransferase (GNAT) family protein [Microbacterium terrae]MBP1077656.1 GNAT superfamily N-acetyltransferase [Microbacterium terrae]GLJ99262.1 N-acetyltransferase [Microbacterium terrae]
MAEITVEPATADRFDDVQHALSGGGDGRGCQCQWWTITNAEFNRSDVDERRGMLRTQVADSPAPGLVAYVDGEAAGWVRVGPRTHQVRLSRTRNYAASDEPWDDASVWAVSCFAVRREHRGAGLNARLLDAAVAFAREHGARVVEAYPLDPGASGKKSTNDLYHGVVSTFLTAGFREVARPRPDVAIVTLEL